MNKAAAIITAFVCLSPVAAVAGGERHALIFGVDQYSQRQQDLVNLDSPRNDIRLYSKILADIGWSISNPREDRQRNVSKDSFNAEIDILKKRNVIGDDILLVFAGHGYSDGVGNRIVFAPPSNKTRYAGPEEITTNSASIGEIVEMLQAGNPRRIILIIDACSDRPIFGSLGTPPEGWSSSLAREDDFDVKSTELLILYSSAPGGIAYDSLGEFDAGGGAGSDYSVFTRMFGPRLREGGPLLRAFIDTRIEVEKLTRNDSEVEQTQRPYILFDALDGEYSLNADDATIQERPLSSGEWRKTPVICRRDDDVRMEAVDLRNRNAWLNEDEKRAGYQCIAQAAIANLGIDAYDFRNKTKVHVSEPTRDSRFEPGDDIRMIQVFDGQGGRKAASRLAGISEFEEILAEHAFRENYQISFLVHRAKSREQEFLRFSY